MTAPFLTDRRLPSVTLPQSKLPASTLPFQTGAAPVPLFKSTPQSLCGSAVAPCNRLGSRFQDAYAWKWTHVVPYSNLGNNFAVTDCQIRDGESRFQDVAEYASSFFAC
jgi:hypothetical protein